MTSYRKPADTYLFYKGREGDPRLGEWVKPLSAMTELSSSKTLPIVLFGSPDDQGVKLNRGRAGAKEGPTCIRQYFYRLTLPMDNECEDYLSLWDYGDCVPGDNIGETHRRSHMACHEIGGSKGVLVAMGGGHDFVAPHFLGFMEGRKAKKAGLINIDPHLDVRVLENGVPNSGTGFRQILESKNFKGSQLIEFGTRSRSNARKYFEYAKKQKVSIQTFESIRAKPSAPRFFATQLKALCKRSDWVGVSFDMDACGETEGVSAPSPVGFSAWELSQMAYACGLEKKVAYLEIAETAPPLEHTERCGRIGAEIIYSFLLGKASN